LWAAALTVEQFGSGLEQLPAACPAKWRNLMECQPDGIQGTEKPAEQIKLALPERLVLVASGNLYDRVMKGCR
jgi:hypothetical protein